MHGYTPEENGALPTRSRSDTAQTRAEIQRAYADFQNACPALADLVPGAVKPAG